MDDTEDLKKKHAEYLKEQELLVEKLVGILDGAAPYLIVNELNKLFPDHTFIVYKKDIETKKE